MSHSIEMGQDFHLARRLTKAIAPDFRVFATESLEEGQCVLDLTKKTIEVGEGTNSLQAAAAILLQAGHLRLRDRTELSEHFGHIDQSIGEKRILKRLAEQGALADKLASGWAIEALTSFWSMEPSKAEALLSAYVWNDTEWKSYIQSV